MGRKKTDNKLKWINWLVWGMGLAMVVGVWTQVDFGELVIDRDWARDLKEISNIHNGDLVWLGPWLDPGLHASSAYYYFFYPAVALAGGDPRGMVWGSVGLYALVIGAWGWWRSRQMGWVGVVEMVALGLSPWVLGTVIHPGNGYTFAVLVLLVLMAVYRRWPLGVTGFLVGLATSFHPAAVVVMPLAVWEGRREKRWWMWVWAGAAMAVPWLPLIGYEVITKGFILRQFLAKPSSGALGWGWDGNSWEFITRAMGFPGWGMVVGLGLVGVIAVKDKRLKWWWRWWGGMWLATGLVTGVLDRYLYGVAVGLGVTWLLTLGKRGWGRWLVWMYAVWLVVAMMGGGGLKASGGRHNVEQMTGLAEEFRAEFGELAGEKLTVMAALDETTLVPQGDDYRAYLRFKGYEVVDITRNSEANYLVMFVEEPGFDWRNWANWEIGEFGEKELMRVAEMEKGTVVVYRRG